MRVLWSIRVLLLELEHIVPVLDKFERKLTKNYKQKGRVIKSIFTAMKNLVVFLVDVSLLSLLSTSSYTPQNLQFHKLSRSRFPLMMWELMVLHSDNYYDNVTGHLRRSKADRLLDELRSWQHAFCVVSQQWSNN